MLHYYAASIHLYEIAFHEPTTSSYPRGTNPLQRIELLQLCLTTSKSLVDAFLSLPASIYNRLPFVAFSLFSLGGITLSRLCLLDSPNWDLSHARSVADLLGVMNLFALRLDEAHSLETSAHDQSQNSQSGIFADMSRRVKKVTAWYENRIATEVNQVSEMQKEYVREDIGGFMNFDDATFWQEFVFDWGMDTFPLA